MLLKVDTSVNVKYFAQLYPNFLKFLHTTCERVLLFIGQSDYFLSEHHGFIFISK